jgi:predicted Rossmann fold nucleotide-binding protein DprA/Smf involved in DNA uptake
MSATGLGTRTFALLLATTPGVGGKTVTRVLARNSLLNRSPEEFLALSPEAMREEYRLTPRAIAALEGDGKALMARTAKLEERLGALGVQLVTAADAHYPAIIEEMDPDPPGVLFLYGNTKLLETRTFCVLSSRNSLPADLDQIEALTEQGVLDSEILVSSHDKPEYQRSAVVPLRWGSPRILCLDRGLFQVLGEDLRNEAFRAARLWRYEFDPHTDLVVSPFRPDDAYIGTNNKRRDRLVACLSRRLDFVQVTPEGNMEALLRMALKAGRSVRVSDRSIGYRGYREQGASIVSEAKTLSD